MSQIQTVNGQQVYVYEGVNYPRVTTVLDLFYRQLYGFPSKAMKDYMTERANIGSAVHYLAERYCKGKPEELNATTLPINDALVVNLFNQARPILDEIRPFISYWEVPVKSNKLMVAGRVDFLTVNPDGTHTIWDIKTSAKPKSEDKREGYWLQLAAYAVCAKETLGTRISGAKVLFLLDNKSIVYEKTGLELLKYADQFVNYRNIFRAKYAV